MLWNPYFINYFYSLSYVLAFDDVTVVEVSGFVDNYYVLNVVYKSVVLVASEELAAFFASFS